MRTKQVWITMVGALLLAAAGGCGNQNLPGTPVSRDDHAHAHQHPAHGPNGGHLIELGEEEYHAEWLHDDATGTITVILLDGKAQDEVGIEADSVNINVAIQGQSPEQYELPAINRSDDDPPKASRFELVSQKLLTALKVGTGVHVTLSANIDGKQYVAQIEHDEHHH